MIAFAAALSLMMQPHMGNPGPPRLSPARRDRIARLCHVPRSSLPLRGGRLHFQPLKIARYQNVNCVLRAIRPRNAPRYIFIGNEGR
jgi:hypothetical protein